MQCPKNSVWLTPLIVILEGISSELFFFVSGDESVGLNKCSKRHGFNFQIMRGRTEERLQRTKLAAAGLIRVFLNVITVY